MKFGVNTATTNCAPCAAVHEKTATHIQKNCDCGHDIAKSICTGQLVDLDADKPIRNTAEGTTKAERELIQSGMDVEFGARISAHVKREQNLHSNLPKAFTYVTNDCCTDGLKTRLIALPDYESAVRDDPLALLTAIKTCVHENAHTQQPPVTVSTHWDRLLKLKQAKEEDPPSHAKRFEQQLKTVKGHIGSAFTDGFAEQMPDCKAHAHEHDAGKITALLDTHVADVNVRKALADDLIDLLSHCKPKETQAQLDVKAQARSEFETYLFLRSVSKAKHGSLLTTLQTQCSLGKEQCPDTIHKAVDILSQHCWDQNPSNQRNRMAILAIPTPTTIPRATTTGTTKTEIRMTLDPTTTLAMSPVLTPLVSRLLALLSRAAATLVGKPSPTLRPSATPVARWATSIRIVTKIFPETAGSSTKLFRPSRTLARTPLLPTSLPTRTTPRLAVNVPRDPPPLLQIAGVTDPTTLAGRVSSSLTLWTNLTSLSPSLALALTGLSATQTSFITFAQPSDP